MTITTDEKTATLTITHELDLSLFSVVQALSEKARLALIGQLMGEGGTGFTAKAREIVNNPGYDE